jgi:hypothetical protein
MRVREEGNDGGGGKNRKKKPTEKRILDRKRNDIAAYNTSQVDGDRIKSGRKGGSALNEWQRKSNEKVGHPSKFRTARQDTTRNKMIITEINDYVDCTTVEVILFFVSSVPPLPLEFQERRRILP